MVALEHDTQLHAGMGGNGGAELEWFGMWGNDWETASKHSSPSNPHAGQQEYIWAVKKGTTLLLIISFIGAPVQRLMDLEGLVIKTEQNKDSGLFQCLLLMQFPVWVRTELTVGLIIQSWVLVFACEKRNLFLLSSHTPQNLHVRLEGAFAVHHPSNKGAAV